MTPPGQGQSIYLWMYRKGLAMEPLDRVLACLELAGHEVREKDVRNYWNGWYRRVLYGSAPVGSLLRTEHGRAPQAYDGYPEHPFLGLPEIANRWVPCNRDNRPMVRWGEGCMTLADARAMRGCEYVAENLRGTRLMVIDVDGDHGGTLDVDALRFFARWRDETCCHDKRRLVLDATEDEQYDLSTMALPTSYHLTFTTDRVIPTMHFPAAHVDVIGNQRNSLRYFKDKLWNGLPPTPMDAETWDDIFDWIEGRTNGNVDARLPQQDGREPQADEAEVR